MEITCKGLAEILLKTPDKPVKVSIDDGTGLQCDANISNIEDIGGCISIIPEYPEY